MRHGARSQTETARNQKREAIRCGDRDDEPIREIALSHNVTIKRFHGSQLFSHVLRRGNEDMKVFISWSGERSRKIADLLHKWLPIVHPSVTPYLSAETIEKGVRWANDVAGGLEINNFGLLCLTPENVNAPWLLFEAGALSKLAEARVAPILFQLRPDAIQEGPLAQFQTTVLQDGEDMSRLFKSINQAAGAERRDNWEITF